MKLFTATFFTAILVSLHASVAQDPSAGAVPIPDQQPSGEFAPAPLFPGGTPPPVVERPHASGGNPGGASNGGKAPITINKRKTTAENIEEVADRIKFREAKTKAMKDEKIQAELASVDAARTDQDKRAALKRYYTVLYAKILKIDGSIKKLVSVRLNESLKQLDQSKVRPEEYSR